MLSNTLVKPTAALEKVMSGEELTFNEGVDLLKNENLFLLGNAANQLRKEIRGGNVSFVSSYYLNYTNVCAASCQLCAFYRKEKDDDAYTLSNEQIVKRAEFAMNNLGATELHIVGGFNPKLGLEYYEDMFKAIKNRFPNVIIKALTPAEIFFISRVTKNSVKEVLERLKYAGLDALPGGGAEIFSKHTRDKIVLGKCSGNEWLNTAYEAHKIGLKGNCTMLFGHIETPEDIVDHIIKLRELNKKTGGFTTFIPLKFSLENTQLEREHILVSESPSIYDLRIIAISRLLLGKVLKNVSVYWIALGKKLAQVALCYGGNDLVGTAFSEEIFKAAGKPNQISIQELKFLIREIKRNPIQRDTFFKTIK
ncbi:CofH family radical SAM protein [soil metagenome]